MSAIRTFATATIFLIFIICCLNTVNGNYAQISNRQSPEQRQTYFETASSRYQDRVAARTKVDLTTSPQPFITQRAGFVDQYSQKRQNQFKNQYSIDNNDGSGKLTLREQYVKDWHKLSPSLQTEIAAKKNTVYNQYINAPQPWLSLNTQSFVELALRGPRPYWIWLTFTVLDGSTHCPTCTTYHNYWTTVTPILQKNAIDSPDEPLPLIMAVVEPIHAREVWKALSLTRAPVSVLLPPEFDINNKIPITEIMTSGVLRQTMMMNPSMEDLVNPLNVNGFEVVFPPPPQPSIFLLIGIFAVMAILSYIVYISFDRLLLLQQYRFIFILLSLFFYIYAVSGGGFVRANKPPMTGHPHGQELWFSREYSQMYGAELYSIMFIHFTTAFGLWCGVVSLIPFGLSQLNINITTPVSFKNDNSNNSNNTNNTNSDSTKDATNDTTSNTNTTDDNNNDNNQKETKITTLDRSAQLERRVAYQIFLNIQPDLLFAIGFGIFFLGYYAVLQGYKVKMPSYPYGF